MPTHASPSLRAELRALMAIALPLAGAQIAQMLIGAISAVMMGRLGADALAAGGLAAGLFFMVVLIAQGVLNAVGPLVAHALGAREEGRIGAIVAQGAYIAVALSLAGILAIIGLGRLIEAMGYAPAIADAARAYLAAATWGFPAALGFALLRSYLSALSRTWPIMALLLLCLGLNAALNELLLFGRLGAPALGVAGSGYAAAAVEWTAFLGLAAYAATQPALRRHRIAAALLRPLWHEARDILRLGWPIAGIFATEAGIFSATALLAGLLGAAALAAHQVAINVTGFTFMVPLAFAQAATMRVALAAGAADMAAARRAGMLAFICGVGFMAAMAVVIFLVPDAIIAIYLDRADPANAAAVAIARRLLLIAALFQVFDGAQTIAAGALRGLKDTRVPLVFGAIGYWAIGLLGSWLLAFPLGLGAPGLWWGLALGLAAVGVPLTLRFRRLTVHRPALHAAAAALY